MDNNCVMAFNPTLANPTNWAGYDAYLNKDNIDGVTNGEFLSGWMRAREEDQYPGSGCYIAHID